MPDDTHIDLSERVAALEQMLVERTAERDDALDERAAGHALLLRWGRDGVGVIALIEVGVTHRLAVGVMPRTDPW